jgi:hypothetical protein
MLISFSHQFIFIHTAKTGGMSMRDVLEPLATELDKFRIHRPPKTIGDQPNPMYTVWETLLLHAKARDVKRELPAEVFDTFFKFAFVRNPWDMQASMYNFMLRDPAIPNHDEVKALGSFDNFIDWVIARKDPYPKGVTKLQADTLTDKDGNLLMDFVGRYENLAEDFAHVGRVIGVDVKLPHLNKSSHKDYRTLYTPDTRQKVAEHFRKDIEMFGYDFDGLVAKPV